jgi:hypothetical protein
MLKTDKPRKGNQEMGRNVALWLQGCKAWELHRELLAELREMGGQPTDRASFIALLILSRG